ncbi:response regulator transcription factor [Bizionia argentinensis JUB59]|uniref:Response regulator transcription factor n=1 Tax=Bizionia argentinensis JUB59 TaxID=1046627 RepID=G2EGJ7_9FLAO|nr:LytTR family transcriptional regulator DNA-binding domain-containing protein [Bizionia argentinensis]EGV42455.1 response regulator transcription factor [Bizionia argentinensis JUB59]
MINYQNPKILIVEDDVIIAEYIAEILEEESFNVIKLAHDKESALNKMISFLPDIILMDINLNGINAGIELSKIKNENATVIFITGQSDFKLMNEALKTCPDAYLTKPIKKVDVIASINLAINKKQIHSFNFKDGYDTIILNHSDIRYIMADGNYSNIYTSTKKYTIRQTLSSIVEKLPSKLFEQTHRSYFVNKDMVERVTANAVFLKGIEIPLSRTYGKYFK